MYCVGLEVLGIGVLVCFGEWWLEVGYYGGVGVLC